MKALLIGLTTVVALAAAGSAQACSSSAKMSSGVYDRVAMAATGSTVRIIVRPDGGGLDADPDVGMPAVAPTNPAPSSPPAATIRR